MDEKIFVVIKPPIYAYYLKIIFFFRFLYDWLPYHRLIVGANF